MCVDAIIAATNAPADPALVETLWRDFGCEGKGLTAEGLQQVQQDLSLASTKVLALRVQKDKY